MLIMEKKIYIVEARENEILSGQKLTEENMENFLSKITEYFNIWVNPYKISISDYGKAGGDKYTFRVTSWEDSK